MKRVLLVVNPSSGGEKARQYEQAAIDKLATYFDDVQVKYTEKAGDATTFAKEAARDQFHSVFVMGGDGTVNEGISGLAEEAHRPNFGFFPLGTVNDLARALNMPLNPQEAIEQLDLDKVRPLDIGKINDKYFMNVVALGALPEAINNVDVEEKTKFGKMAYFMSGFRNLMKHHTYDFQVTIDGETQSITSTTILIGLTNSIGGFEQILPSAQVDDGLLHMIYLKDSNLIETLMAVPSLVSGVEESNRSVGYQSFTEARFSIAEGELTVNVDGDEGAALPIDVSVLSSHLNVYA